jgi:uncharacterized coiled-coil DUF342 family protein
MDKEQMKKEYEDLKARVDEMGDEASDEMREKRDDLKNKIDEWTD